MFLWRHPFLYFDGMISMKAMLLLNTATEAYLVDGLRGTTDNIILDPREILEANESSTRAAPPGTIPTYPARKSLRLGVKSGNVVGQEQVTLTSIRLTDFKSQGQII